MEELIKMSVVISLLVLLMSPAADTIPNATVVPYQKVICAYHATTSSSAIAAHQHFNGEVKFLSNDSIECVLRNSVNTASCLAIMSYINNTDSLGNVYVDFDVIFQGCWESQSSVTGVGHCPAVDECVSESTENIGKVCCCRLDSCNRLENLQVPHLADVTSVPTASTGATKKAKMSATITTIVVSLSSLLLLLAAVATVYFCYKRKKDRERGPAVQVNPYRQLEHKDVHNT